MGLNPYRSRYFCSVYKLNFPIVYIPIYTEFAYKHNVGLYFSVGLPKYRLYRNSSILTLSFKSFDTHRRYSILVIADDGGESLS